MALARFTEWEGTHTRLVRLGGLPSRGQYNRIQARPIRHVVCHQSSGNSLVGESAALRIAEFHTGTPKYKMKDGRPAYRTVRGNPKKHWIGGGHGWPGIGYQFIVPTIPDTVDGKMEVYRAHADEVHSYHTEGLFDMHGVGVVLVGTYKSRHVYKPASRTKDRPDSTAMLAFKELVLDYLLPRYNLAPETDGALMGHFDTGKLACPGDFIEQWIRANRGENVLDPTTENITLDGPLEDVETPRRTLDSDSERQSTLNELGFDVAVDGVWGPLSCRALTAFQDIFMLVKDGTWGPITERTIRAALEGWNPSDR